MADENLIVRTRKISLHLIPPPESFRAPRHSCTIAHIAANSIAATASGMSPSAAATVLRCNSTLKSTIWLAARYYPAPSIRPGSRKRTAARTPLFSPACTRRSDRTYGGHDHANPLRRPAHHRHPELIRDRVDRPPVHRRGRAISLHRGMRGPLDPVGSAAASLGAIRKTTHSGRI